MRSVPITRSLRTAPHRTQRTQLTIASDTQPRSITADVPEQQVIADALVDIEIQRAEAATENRRSSM